jgi:hypothetical protein
MLSHSLKLDEIFKSHHAKLDISLKRKGQANTTKPSVDTLRARHRFTTAEIKKKGIYKCNI